ncbi:hypothetical protein ACJX0J_010751, partial [Zea mays]
VEQGIKCVEGHEGQDQEHPQCAEIYEMAQQETQFFNYYFPLQNCNNQRAVEAREGHFFFSFLKVFGLCYVNEVFYRQVSGHFVVEVKQIYEWYVPFVVEVKQISEWFSKTNLLSIILIYYHNTSIRDWLVGYLLVG